MLAVFLMGTLSIPVPALAYVAKGITSPGLVYDDVYGVANGVAIMSNSDGTDFVDSSGTVLKHLADGTSVVARNTFEDGFLKIKNGDNKFGAIKADGSDLVPCEYEDLWINESRSYFAGLTTESDRAILCLIRAEDGRVVDQIECGASDSAAHMSVYWASDESVRVYDYDGGTTKGFLVSNDHLSLVSTSDNSERIYEGVTFEGSKFSVKYIPGKQEGSEQESSQIVFCDSNGSEVKRLSGNYSWPSIVGEVVMLHRYESSYSDSSDCYDFRGNRASIFDKYAVYGAFAACVNHKCYLGASKNSGSNSYEITLLNENGKAIKTVNGLDLKSNAYIYSTDSASLDGFMVGSTYDNSRSFVDCNGNVTVRGTGAEYGLSYGSGYIIKPNGDENTLGFYRSNGELVATLPGNRFYFRTENLVQTWTGDNDDRDTPAVKRLFDLSESGKPFCLPDGVQVASYASLSHSNDNACYRPTADAWWAQNADGKWGLETMPGDVVVPFEYDAYYDLGLDSTSLVLVKKDGKWYFYDTAEGGSSKPNNPGSFSDVDSSTPHADDVLWLVANGISTGWKESDGSSTFRSFDTVKRCDMAAFLYRLAGSPDYDAPTTSPFSDVDSSTPHYKEVCWLASTAISKGWDNGDGTAEFRPYDTVKRCDMAAFLRRLADSLDNPGVSDETNPFSDVDETTPHSEDVLWLASNGISAGWKESDGSSTFRSYDTVKRCDMAAFLHRMSVNGLA